MGVTLETGYQGTALTLRSQSSISEVPVQIFMELACKSEVMIREQLKTYIELNIVWKLLTG